MRNLLQILKQSFLALINIVAGLNFILRPEEAPILVIQGVGLCWVFFGIYITIEMILRAKGK